MVFRERREGTGTGKAFNLLFFGPQPDRTALSIHQNILRDLDGAAIRSYFGAPASDNPGGRIEGRSST